MSRKLKAGEGEEGDIKIIYGTAPSNILDSGCLMLLANSVIG
jgi:hypothetical protein